MAGRVDTVDRERGEVVVAGQRLRIDPATLPFALRVGDVVAVSYEWRDNETWVLEVWPGRR